MQKQFVTYDIALKLKELGFNEPCLAFYNPDSKELSPVYQEPSKGYFNIACSDETIHAPLWQQVVDWFRENNNIHISILYDKETDYHYHTCVINLKQVNRLTTGYYNTYNEAREQIILKLLELWKNN